MLLLGTASSWASGSPAANPPRFQEHAGLALMAFYLGIRAQTSAVTKLWYLIKATWGYFVSFKEFCR